MATLSNSTLRTLITLAREGVAARGGPFVPTHDLDEALDTIALAERTLADSQESVLRAERLEAALADCYLVMHDLRLGYREHELPRNPQKVETEARELLGLPAPVRVAVD